MSDLQRHLFDNGVSSMVATEVTEQIMGITRSEAYEAYIGSSFRAAERNARREVLDDYGGFGRHHFGGLARHQATAE